MDMERIERLIAQVLQSDEAYFVLYVQMKKKKEAPKNKASKSLFSVERPLFVESFTDCRLGFQAFIH